MTKEMAFFIFLIEKYAYEKKIPTGAVIQLWNEHGITQEIYDNYEMYHQERLENAFEDIECLIKTGKHAF